MQAFVRTGMTSGVALIGASAIALSPIVVAPQQVHLPAVPVSSLAATLTAQVDPISEWAQVLTTTFNNVSALGQQVWADPAPILKQIIINQLGYANTTVNALSSAGSSFVTALQALPPAFGQAGQQLAAGQISAGLDTAYQAMVSLVLQPGFALLGSGILDIPGKVMQNITNVVKLAPSILVGLGFSALSTAFSVESAFNDTAQAVYDGMRAGNLGAALNAIVNAPAVLTNAFLNGYNTAAGGRGILAPGGLVPTLVVAVRDAIAQALGAPVPPAAAAAASPAAKVADVGPAALPSAALAAATVTLGAEKVTAPDVVKVAAPKTAPAEPAAAAPAGGAPAAASPEMPSTATEPKPESGTTSGGTTTAGGTTTGTTGEPTKPSGSTGSGTGSGSTTTPKGGTDTTGGSGTSTTGGTKTGTTGEPTRPTKPSGSTGSETGSGGTSTPKDGTSTTGGTKTGTPGKTGQPAKPTKPSGSTGSGTGSGSTGSGSGSGASASGGGASHAAA